MFLLILWLLFVFWAIPASADVWMVVWARAKVARPDLSPAENIALVPGRGDIIGLRAGGFDRWGRLERMAPVDGGKLARVNIIAR